jgi:hypothetical protein
LGLTLSQISDDMPSCNVGHANKILIEDQVKSIMPKRSGIGLSGSTLAIIRAWPSGLAVNICGQESGACKESCPGRLVAHGGPNNQKKMDFCVSQCHNAKLIPANGSLSGTACMQADSPMAAASSPTVVSQGRCQGAPAVFLE